MTQHQIVMPPVEERDQAMGAYMDAWGRLEGSLTMILAELLLTSNGLAQSVFLACSVSRYIDLVAALAAQTLTIEGQKEIDSFREALRRRNVRRNNLVHGSWSMTAILSEAGLSQQWIRRITPSSKSMFEAWSTETNAVESFTIEQIKETTEHVNGFISRAYELMRRIPSLRDPALFPPPAAG